MARPFATESFLQQFRDSTIALYNNQTLVPRLVMGGSGRARDWTVLRKTVGVEIVGLVLVIVFTGFLVGLTPPRNAVTSGVVESTGPFEVGDTLDDDYQLFLRVDPARVGENVVQLVLESDGHSDDPLAQEVRLRLEQPGAGIGPIRVDMEPVDGRTFLYQGPVFAVAGAWTVEVRLRVSTFTEKVATFQVPISP